MSTDIDRIMHEDPLKLTKSDLKALIAHHRGRRGKEETEEAKPKRKLDLRAMGLIKDKPKVKFARRF